MKTGVVSFPNHEKAIKTETKVLCLACNMPSAVFYEKDNKRYRLAKTFRRITARTLRDSKQQALYVHEEPCLAELVRNWAKYIVNEQGLKALAKREDNAKSTKPDSGHTGKDSKDMGSEKPLS